MAESVAVVPGRACGPCALCCKVLRIEELDKPAGRWCPHCTAGRDGCRIYDTRPPSCRSFHCAWLIDPKLGAEWHPATAKMVLHYDRPARRLAVHVDPEFPSAWRSEPYYRQLKAWTCAAIEGARTPSSDAWLMAPVLVYVDDSAIVLLPNRDIEVGRFTPGSELVVTEKAGAGGPDFDAWIMPPEDVASDRDEASPGRTE
jgi:Fe-S-cluster containining protein